MKKYVLAVLPGFPALAQAQAPAAFTLKGRLAQVAGPAKAYLRREGLQHAKITGSALTAEYQVLTAQLKPSTEQLDALYAQYRAAPGETAGHADRCP
ncbi:hypothetical protein [Hymenobacter terricola]|uniref:hypothetical protein n=1 Tax=Hymenobacter terricola TaxID=2819236 RepID=UPI001B31619B|nr:hypothetical protein [Hymenobacter terricola]